MLKHIVMWNINEEVSDKESLKEKIKSELEVLKKEIPQIQSIKLITKLEDSSTHDIALISEFLNKEDLKTYANHPKHVKVGKELIAQYCKNRCCIDFFE